MSERTLGLISSAAGGADKIRQALIEPAIARGWRVAVTVTPTAGTWLRANGELDRIETVTGLPARVFPRMPTETSPHPPIDRYLVCPASANTIAKLALGIADNQALTTVCEAICAQAVPVIVYPRLSAAYTRQPAWNAHITALRDAGVHLLGDEYQPVPDPRTATGKDMPWAEILNEVESLTSPRLST